MSKYSYPAGGGFNIRIWGQCGDHSVHSNELKIASLRCVRAGTQTPLPKVCALNCKAELP